MSIADGGLASVEVIGRLLSGGGEPLTARRIQQLAKDGIIPKASRGRYPVVGCVQGYIGYLKKRAEANQRAEARALPHDLAEERRQKTAVERALLEIDLELRRQSIVEVERFREALSDAYARVATRLRSLPPALAQVAVGVQTVQEGVLRMEPLVYELLEELASAEDVPAPPKAEAESDAA